MNIEKTIEFILDNQAKAEERWAKAEGRFAKFEKTIEFILDNQAKAEERSNKSERRLDRLERMVAQNNRLVARLARAGVTLRSDVRRHERAITRTEENLAEATDKLNALIDVVDKSLRRNGGGR
jgi:uncharacterized coiled-coil protein SlyX